jgi:hypothetical protein
MRFAGYEVEKKRLSRTVATQKTDEIVGLWNSNRPRANGHDLPVMKKWLQNSRFCRAGHNREVILVFQFSSRLIDAQGWLRQCEANPGRFRLRFFSQKPEQGKIGAEIYSGD